MLTRLIYTSTVREDVNLEELQRILTQSQTNNQKRDLTGVLAFNSKIVLQGLEGGRDEINALYTKLLADPRHHKVVMLKYQEIRSRQWANWSMGFAAPHAANRAIFLKHSQHSAFNPYVMGGDAVENMLLDMAGKTVAMVVSDNAFGMSAPASATTFAAPAPQPAMMRSTPSMSTGEQSPAREALHAAMSVPAAASPQPGAPTIDRFLSR